MQKMDLIRSLGIRLLLGIFVVCVLLFTVHRALVEYVRHRISTEREMIFMEETGPSPADAVEDPNFADLPPPVPFQEIEPFDVEAHSWTNNQSQFGAGGVAVFDADGDGRLDVYLCHDGQNWTRATDANGVVQDEPRYQSNGLYLNRGNDSQGQPIFASVAELARQNRTRVAQELLIEDYLWPRQTADDSVKRLGRISNVAVAADFNGDGRLDLLVGNEPKGVYWSHPETQRVLNPLVDPVGRQAKHSKMPLVSLASTMIQYEPRQGVHQTRESARGVEAEGANSLYLNLGDRDGDGLPEWEDVSRETGIEGRGATYGLAIADVDLDGDLDVYVANAMDLDFWPGGSTKWAGGANELFINQLAETGELKFVEQAAAMDVDGVYDDENPRPSFHRLKSIPYLPIEYSLLLPATEAYLPDYLTLNGEEAEHAQISWAAVFQDVNLDGFPDLWVANDLGYLRLYINERGRGFVEQKHARSERSGSWMALAPADYTGDLVEDMIIGNLGGGVMSHAFVTLDVLRMLNPTMLDAMAFQQFILDKTDATHAVLDGSDLQRELHPRVRHSAVLPPDASLPQNQRRHAPKSYTPTPFDPSTLDPYEFAWGMTTIDVQNDGRMDLYHIGCLFSRGGGLFPIAGTNPGRLLVNATRNGGELRFADLTAEYHLFNIEELRYDKLDSEGIIYRPAPTKNWSKRDVVRSTDRSTWSAQGPGTQEHVTNHDLIQAAENGRAVVTPDLNGDGFSDLILTNVGGYDSRGSKAVNLKIRVDGQPKVVPPPDNLYYTLTNFEPGRTRVFLNRSQNANWLKVRLIDDSPGCLNRDAVGARVVVNGRLLRVKRAGSGGYLGNLVDDLHFGLGDEQASQLKIYWPDKERTVVDIELENLANTTLIVSKTRGVLSY